MKNTLIDFNEIDTILPYVGQQIVLISGDPTNITLLGDVVTNSGYRKIEHTKLDVSLIDVTITTETGPLRKRAIKALDGYVPYIDIGRNTFLKGEALWAPVSSIQEYFEKFIK